MKIKNFVVNNPNLTTDLIVRGLCLNNIDYVLIKSNGYQELHYLDNIYRFFDINDKSILKELLKPSKKIDKGESVMKVNVDFPLYTGMEDIKFCQKARVKNNSGYKVLKKDDYKRKQSIKRFSSKNRNR